MRSFTAKTTVNMVGGTAIGSGVIVNIWLNVNPNTDGSAQTGALLYSILIATYFVTGIFILGLWVTSLQTKGELKTVSNRAAFFSAISFVIFIYLIWIGISTGW